MCLLDRSHNLRRGGGRGVAALQGIDPVGPGNHSEDWLQPPWGLQPLPISENPPADAGEPVKALEKTNTQA